MNGCGHIAKIAVMLIYDKSLVLQNQMAAGIENQYLEYCQTCLNDDSMLTFDHFIQVIDSGPHGSIVVICLVATPIEVYFVYGRT